METLTVKTRAKRSPKPANQLNHLVVRYTYSNPEYRIKHAGRLQLLADTGMATFLQLVELKIVRLIQQAKGEVSC